jgi:hypothetical protein
LVGVEYGGWALLGFLTGRGQLGEFREQFFRAGRAHAGMLLVLSLVYFLYLDRTGCSTGVQWLAGLLLDVGIIVQSGGFFLHLARPEEPELGRNDRDTNRRPPSCGGADHLGHRPVVVREGQTAGTLEERS